MNIQRCNKKKSLKMSIRNNDEKVLKQRKRLSREGEIGLYLENQ
ncbi:unnamed protein product [Paramecium sonneborni]|uniref:Uncharacterized protein n=1 Tax=Paramecium sonneborni TaxID=65129 RepID=A0A8S1QT03_9CILI|nr:unnamed protein product [Paramecium sonneborni]